MAYPTTLDSFTTKNSGDTIAESHVNSLQTAVVAIETKLGVDSSAVTTTLDYLVKSTSSSNPGHKHTLANGATDVNASASEVNVAADLTVNAFFASGRALWFYADTAPTGWTYSSGITDNILAVKGGSQAYNVSGGGYNKGTWTASGLTADSHTHTSAAHLHQWHNYVGTSDPVQIYNSGGNAVDITHQTTTTIGISVEEGISTDRLDVDAYTTSTTPGVTGTASATGVSSTGAWRPYAAVGIIATKDA